MRELRKNSNKRLAIVAPSSVAAINAGGTTIHSLFQLPNDLLQQMTAGVFAPHTQQFNNEKKKLFTSLELLVIDEISMVRADMFDAMDIILRTIRATKDLPFGGVQILLVGDLFQLPPVLKTEEETLFNKFYLTPYFFGASVISSLNLIKLELSIVYRQSDMKFVEILNRIRNNRCTEDDVRLINEKSSNSANSAEKGITLTTHNSKAEKINKEELSKLLGEEISYSPLIVGDFPEPYWPLEKTLMIKKGAKVVFIKNDSSSNKAFFNGQQGVVISTNSDVIEILSNHEILKIKKEIWIRTNYKLSEASKRIEQEIIGEFHQFPIQLAWAITIHKSQGLSFDTAILDLEDSFVSGQIYVALSRLRTLNGLTVRSKINISHLTVDPRIETYLASFNNQSVIAEIIANENRDFLQKKIVKLLSIDETIIIEGTFEKGFDIEIQNLQTEFENVYAISNTFQNHLTGLFSNMPIDLFLIKNRILAAINYFKDVLNNIITHLQSILSDSKETKKIQQKRKFKLLANSLKGKIKEFDIALSILDLLSTEQSIAQVIATIDENKILEPVIDNAEVLKNQKIKSSLNYLDVVNKVNNNKSSNEIARELGISAGAVDQQILKGVHAGNLSAENIVDPAIYSTMSKIIAANADKSAAFIHKNLAPEVSLIDIKLIMTDLENKKNNLIH